MNTIKVITILICTILCAAVSAQEQLYNVSRTFHESGFTYRADVMPGGTVVLFNANNRHDFHQRQTFRDGSPLSAEDIRGGLGAVVTPRISTAIPTVTNIVRNALSPAERQRVGDWPLIVRMYVNQEATTPQSVTEVKFTFSTNSPFATLPVSVYRQIELEIKRQVRFAPTASGRNLNFVVVGFPVRVN